MLAADEGALLKIVDDEARRAELARLVEAGDRSQERWPVLRELLAWVRLPGRHARDGLSLATTLHGARDRAAHERARRGGSRAGRGLDGGRRAAGLAGRGTGANRPHC